MTLHTYNPRPSSLPSINFIHLTVLSYSPRQDFIGQCHYSKVKDKIKIIPCRCRPRYPNQCSYQVSTSYTLQFPRYSPTRYYKSRSLRQGQRLNQGHIMTLHTYNPLTNVPTHYQHPDTIGRKQYPDSP